MSLDVTQCHRMSHTKCDIVILEERMNRLLDPPILIQMAYLNW